ncbi:hypothetical protein PRZ48_003153 [Zasmidium cellare]|uniref:DUF4440 domain-containing protein n=1 Tax=Zasmidium cellare TaxID=395010 RepID=A0ABR0EUR7_ZASCE|nr:hypothetical protein PRZ48_003153 [Zasmidium cellare]
MANPSFTPESMDDLETKVDLELMKDLESMPDLKTDTSTRTPGSTSSPSVKKPLTSLDILCPTPSTSDVKPPKSATALFLEGLHHQIVTTLNARDFDSPILTTYLDPNLTAYMEHTTAPYVTDRTAFLNRYRTMAAEHPNYRFELAEVEASVDEERGKALCFFKLRIWGHPEGVEREGVYVNMWKRKKGNWVCKRQNGVRGMKVGEGS